MSNQRRILPDKLPERGGFADPATETSWQAIDRDQAMALKGTVKIQKVVPNSSVLPAIA